MNKLLPILLLIVLSITACKKERKETPAEPTPVTVTTPVQTGGPVSITSISPASGLPNTVVTINGTNFKNAANDLTVLFSGVKAVIQSVTPTELKVLVPVTTTGKIAVILGTSGFSGPEFTYIDPALNTAYVNGDVILHNQSEIDLFVSLYKEKQLLITGNLTIGSASDI